MWDQVSSEWDVYRMRARAQWPAIPADRIDATGGDRAGLVALLERYGQRTHEDAESEVDAWAQTADGRATVEGERNDSGAPGAGAAPGSMEGNAPQTNPSLSPVGDRPGAGEGAAHESQAGGQPRAWSEGVDDSAAASGAYRQESDLRAAIADGTADWGEVRDRLQMRWRQFADIDLGVIEGGRDAILTVLQGRLGYAQANAEADLDMVLAGKVIVPRDVADEEHHTGSSGPVLPSGERATAETAHRTEGSEPRL